MAQYTNEYSRFPETLYQLHNFLDLKDAPDSINALVNQIKRLNMSGDYAAASAMLYDSRTVLAPYFIDADVVNGLEEELRNLEIYAKTQKQTLWYQSTEPIGVNGDVWIET